MNRLLDILHRIFTSRYVLHLEQENRRLRDENRQLWSSLWGTRGHNLPPLSSDPAPSPSRADVKPQLKANRPPVGRPSWFQLRHRRQTQSRKDALERLQQEQAEFLRTAKANALAEATKAQVQSGAVPLTAIDAPGLTQGGFDA